MFASLLHINQMVKDTDAALLSLFADEATRERGFKQIIATYKERLYWHIRRMVVQHDDADDVLQETFIKVWKHLPNFRGESSLYTWLYRIATNCALTFIEQRTRKATLSLEATATYLQNAISNQPGYDATKIEWKLQNALATLPAKQRTVFNLRYYDELSYEQMSEVLETSAGALKASYHHAAKKIQEYLLNN